ncbi:hypothetical protein JXC34_02310 [Candidatus Woesearchaeota archaeon]|nr:hypothetical protein [Candidatus Woesearchaeota archaeon]
MLPNLVVEPLGLAEIPCLEKKTLEVRDILDQLHNGQVFFRRILSQDEAEDWLAARHPYSISINLAKLGLNTRIILYEENKGFKGFRIYQFPDENFFLIEQDYVIIMKNYLLSLLPLLGGNDVELDTSRIADSASRDSAYWDNWKKNKEGAHYKLEIYPRCVEAISAIAGEFNGGEMTLVDLFGGDGEFIYSLSSIIEDQYPRLKMSYHVVDNNLVSIERANELHIGSAFSAHLEDLAETENIFQVIGAAPYIVTAIGGLNKNVISKEEARKLAGTVYEGLNPGGFFVVTGYSSCHMNSLQFSEIGFEILNMSLPENIATGKVPKHFYILKKPNT